ncbi:MAG: DUF1328 domain-containing protein [Caulobacter sp.]|jgi:uncharacterized membrane protein YtjA (UPF0391 family)
MLKWAGIFLVVMIIAGILGFVLDVAGGIAQILFWICLIGFLASVAMRYMKKT